MPCSVNFRNIHVILNWKVLRTKIVQNDYRILNWKKVFLTNFQNDCSILKETDNLRGPNFNLITQREIFLLRNIRYGMATILCWFWTILIFGTKIQRSFKFLEGVMIYNYKSGLLLDYCFDTKFTHFEPFSLFARFSHFCCTITSDMISRTS